MWPLWVPESAGGSTMSEKATLAFALLALFVNIGFVYVATGFFHP
jgi:hypothetical protein